MPASAVQTKTWFRPNGWFTDREVAIVVNRVLRDDPSKGEIPCVQLNSTQLIVSLLTSEMIGDMHNRQALTPRRLWQTLKDYDLWPLYLLGLVVFIPQSPPTKYLTLIVKSLGFSTFNTNLLTIPSVSQSSLKSHYCLDHGLTSHTEHFPHHNLACDHEVIRLVQREDTGCYATICVDM